MKQRGSGSSLAWSFKPWYFVLKTLWKAMGSYSIRPLNSCWNWAAVQQRVQDSWGHRLIGEVHSSFFTEGRVWEWEFLVLVQVLGTASQLLPVKSLNKMNLRHWKQDPGLLPKRIFKLFIGKDLNFSLDIFCQQWFYYSVAINHMPYCGIHISRH